jgi:membrane associated rhomboid family serine protease
MQLLSFAVGDGQLDGVAYAVHVGGFAVGVLGAVVWKTMVPSAEEKLLEFTESSFVPPPVRRGWRRLLGS